MKIKKGWLVRWKIFCCAFKQNWLKSLGFFVVFESAWKEIEGNWWRKGGKKERKELVSRDDCWVDLPK
ncbi:unnamed protein product [Meloidogyne enterolobii]|uniref:Uncharacterized protein n=1 Tax=Meloidogyne enterolobii TaxID=390850 RepID=A0ACB0ZN75_MELEN